MIRNCILYLKSHSDPFVIPLSYLTLLFLLQHPFLCWRHRYGYPCHRSWWDSSSRICVRIFLCSVSYFTSEVSGLRFHDRNNWPWLTVWFNISSLDFLENANTVSALETQVSLTLQCALAVYDARDRWVILLVDCNLPL